MELEQLIQQLDAKEQTEFEALVSEIQATSDSRAIRGRLAHLAMRVLKRLGEKPNPGPIIGQFIKLYSPAEPDTDANDVSSTEMESLEVYPQMIVQPMLELEKSIDPVSSHKALLDLGEALLVYLTGILFGEYRKFWPLDEGIEAEFYKNAKRKPSFGVFLGFLRRLVQTKGESIIDHLFHKQAQFNASSEYVMVYSLLCQVINQGRDDNFQPVVKEMKQGRTLPKRNVINFYDSFISMRNSYAHPEDKAKNPERKWPLGEDYYSLINPYVKAGLEELIANLEVITKFQPIWLKQVDDLKQKGQVIVEIGEKGLDEIFPLSTDELDFIDTEERYLKDPHDRVYTKLYYNKIPQLSPTIAQQVINQQKAKMMEPVLRDSVLSKLADGAIDDIEYMVLKDTAISSSISEERLNNIIESVKKELNLEGDIFVKEKEKMIPPRLEPWWLYHFGWLDTSKVEHNEDPLNKTNAHVLLWKQVTKYLEYLVEQHLNNSFVEWKIKVNRYQIGALSYTYWAQIYPEVSPLETYFSVGFAISKKYRWTTAKKESGSRLLECLKKPVMTLWTSSDRKVGGDIDYDKTLWSQYEATSHDLLLREKDKLIELKANVSGLFNDQRTILPAEEYLNNYRFNESYHFEQLYSALFNIEDFLEDDQVTTSSVQNIEKQIVSFMTLFSNSVLNAVDHAIARGINLESVKSFRDHARRNHERLDLEIEALIKENTADQDQLKAFIRNRGQELEVSDERIAVSLRKHTQVESGNRASAPPSSSRSKRVKFPVYRKAKPEINLSDQVLTEIPINKIADWIDSIVEIESPVSIQTVIWRICEAANIGRAGSKVQATIEQAIKLAVTRQNISKRKDFLWLNKQTEVTTRNRKKLSSRERDIDLISEEEVQAAIIAVYGQPILISDQNMAAKRICQLLGFGRVSLIMETKVNQQIQKLMSPSK